MLRRILRNLLAAIMTFAGVLHFAQPGGFVRIVPHFLPAPLLLVWISGAFEIAFGIGLLVPRLRKWSSYGLVLLYIAVFPANVNMALNHLPLSGNSTPEWLLWARLPLQLVLIVWALWAGGVAPRETRRPSA